MNYLRQLGLYDPEKYRKFSLGVIGCGSVGSNIALQAAKIGVPKIFLWDPDIVEEHNLPNQAFLPGMVGRNKAEACAEMCKLLNPEVEVNCFNQGFESFEQMPEIILVSAVDSMKSRIEIWKKIKKVRRAVKLYVDSRMAGLFGRIFFVLPGDPCSEEKYRNSLYDDSEAVPLPCTERAIFYAVSIIAGFALASIVKAITEEFRNLPEEIRIDIQALSVEAQGCNTERCSVLR